MGKMNHEGNFKDIPHEENGFSTRPLCPISFTSKDITRTYGLGSLCMQDFCGLGLYKYPGTRWYLWQLRRNPLDTCNKKLLDYRYATAVTRPIPLQKGGNHFYWNKNMYIFKARKFLATFHARKPSKTCARGLLAFSKNPICFHKPTHVVH